MLKARLNLQLRKSDPPFVTRLYAQFYQQTNLVFTHGFINIALSTATLICKMSER